MIETPTLDAAGPRLKTCPRCAEEIDVLARWCPWCGAHFLVEQTGYCTHCHGMSTPDGSGRCKTCGETLIDVRVESELVREATVAPEQVASQPVTPPAVAPAAPAPIAVELAAAAPAPAVPRVHPSSPSTAAAQVVGTPRAGVALSRLQRVPHVLLATAAVVIFAQFVVQFENHSLALAIRGGPFLEQVVMLGWAAPAAAILIALVVPQGLGPKGVRGGLFSKGRREELKLLDGERRRLGVGQLVGGRRYRTRLGVVAALWVAGILATAATLIRYEDATVQPGVYVAFGSMAIGLLGAVALLATRKRCVWVDDVGHLSEAASLTPEKS